MPHRQLCWWWSKRFLLYKLLLYCLLPACLAATSLEILYSRAAAHHHQHHHCVCKFPPAKTERDRSQGRRVFLCCITTATVTTIHPQSSRNNRARVSTNIIFYGWCSFYSKTLLLDSTRLAASLGAGASLISFFFWARAFSLQHHVHRARWWVVLVEDGFCN